MKTLSILIVCAAFSASAGAQTVWRCGLAGSSYSATPCADGRPVEVADPRGATERQAANEVAAQERRTLALLAAERRAREADAVRRGLGPAGIKPLAAPSAEPSPRRGKKLRPRQDFVARAY